MVDGKKKERLAKIINIVFNWYLYSVLVLVLRNETLEKCDSNDLNLTAKENEIEANF